jgi:hypothetical protein
VKHLSKIIAATLFVCSTSLLLAQASTSKVVSTKVVFIYNPKLAFNLQQHALDSGCVSIHPVNKSLRVDTVYATLFNFPSADLNNWAIQSWMSSNGLVPATAAELAVFGSSTQVSDDSLSLGDNPNIVALGSWNNKNSMLVLLPNNKLERIPIDGFKAKDNDWFLALKKRL